MGSSTLAVGFDSAWTARHSGGVVGVLQLADGSVRQLEDPLVADFVEARAQIDAWQATHCPDRTLILLDQPTVVANAEGQRPVENLVSGPVSRRRGGVQPSNTGRVEMFGDAAPLWPFLEAMGGVVDLDNPSEGGAVLETYPALILIAMGWVVPDSRPTGSLPKYNPERRKTFRLADWQFVCAQLQRELTELGVPGLARWCADAGQLTRPRKHDQDRLDACLCLLPALMLARGSACTVVGQADSGFLVVPTGEELDDELRSRCTKTQRDSAAWVRDFALVSSWSTHPVKQKK